MSKQKSRVNIEITEVSNGYYISWHTKAFEERTAAVFPLSAMAVVKKVTEILSESEDLDVWEEAKSILSLLEQGIDAETEPAEA